MQKRFEKALLITVIVLAVLILGSAFLNYTGAVVFTRGASGNINLSYGGLADYYYQYSEVVDFFIFLFLFIGLSSMIFGKQFENVNKSVYVGLGIFLALALVLWENRTGNNLVEISGPFAIAIVVIAILLVIYNQLKGFQQIGIVNIAWTYIVFYILFFIVFDVYNAPFIDSLRYYLPIDIISLLSILFAAAVFIAIGGLLYNWKGRKNKNE